MKTYFTVHKLQYHHEKSIGLVGRPGYGLEKTKTKNRREIPINDDLTKVFKGIRKEQGLTSQYISTYN